MPYSCKRNVEKNHNLGHIISLSFPNAHCGFVVADKYPNEAISRNGMHYGYLYNDIVYCNIYPEGLPKEQWINSFHADTGEPPIVTIY